MTVLILPSAKQDLAEGYEFYECQGQGLGAYFLESLFSDIDSLRIYAGVHAKEFRFHRLLSKRFPYAVYYSVKHEAALVSAVLDCRRDPRWIRGQLRSDRSKMEG
jgi:hypothetical protein